LVIWRRDATAAASLYCSAWVNGLPPSSSPLHGIGCVLPYTHDLAERVCYGMGIYLTSPN